MVVLSVSPVCAQEITCVEPPVIYRDTNYNVNVTSIHTGTFRRLGWCCPLVLEGEPPITLYKIWLNGVPVYEVLPTGQSSATNNWTEEYRDFSMTLLEKGTNVIYLTCTNEQGSESDFSGAIAVVFNPMAKPINLNIK